MGCPGRPALGPSLMDQELLPNGEERLGPEHALCPAGAREATGFHGL